MSALLVGYARCSTDQQDLTGQRDGLLALGVETGRIYVDNGLTGTNRERPGHREVIVQVDGVPALPDRDELLSLTPTTAQDERRGAAYGHWSGTCIAGTVFASR